MAEILKKNHAGLGRGQSVVAILASSPPRVVADDV